MEEQSGTQNINESTLNPTEPIIIPVYSQLLKNSLMLLITLIATVIHLVAIICVLLELTQQSSNLSTVALSLDQNTNTQKVIDELLGVLNTKC